MPLPFCILLQRILHSNLPAREILVIHLLYGNITGLKVIIAHKAIAFTGSILNIPGNLRAYNEPKITKSLIEHLLINLRIQIPNKQIGADLLRAFILRGLIDFDGLAVEFDHVHDLDGVVGVLLAFELDEAVPLVLVADFVPGDVHVDDGAALSE